MYQTNMVWITSNAALLARYTQDDSSMGRAMMTLTNPLIEYYFASMSTVIVSTYTSKSEVVR